MHRGLPPWRGNPPFAGGGCARRREAPTPRKRRNFPLLAGGELLQPAFEDFWRLDLCCHQETREDSSFIVSSDHLSSLSSSVVGGRLPPAPPPAKGGLFLLLRGMSASRRLAHPPPAKGGFPLHGGGASVHGGRSSISPQL